MRICAAPKSSEPCPGLGQHLEQRGAERRRPRVAGLQLVEAARQLRRQPRFVDAEVLEDAREIACPRHPAASSGSARSRRRSACATGTVRRALPARRASCRSTLPISDFKLTFISSCLSCSNRVKSYRPDRESNGARFHPGSPAQLRRCFLVRAQVRRAALHRASESIALRIRFRCRGRTSRQRPQRLVRRPVGRKSRYCRSVSGPA